MPDFILSCESTADLTAEQLEVLGVEHVCFHFYLDGKDYMDDLGKSIPFPDFYKAMENGADTKTAAVGTGAYNEYFRPFLEQGKDILHLSLSSGISSTYQAALLSSQQLSKEFPDRKIYVVDSLSASSGYGLFMAKLSEMRAAGASIDELHDWSIANRNKLQHWFFSTDLTFFIKGGRVSPVSGYVGNLLGICPLLNVNSEGALIPREKIRSKKKVIKRIVDVMQEHAQDGLDYSDKVFISQAACVEDAEAVAKLIEKRFTKMDGKVQINYIGTTIGSHTGPGTVALFFWGDERTL